MTIFWLTLSFVFLVSVFSRLYSVSTTGPILVYSKPNKILVSLVIIIIVLVSGLRNNIGDTYTYIQLYVNGDFSWESILSGKDIGFNIFQMLLKNISDDPQLLIFITALITNLLIILVLYNYSRIFELGIYVYITVGMYLTSMNGIRQYLAAAIVFAATKYIFDGNWKKYFLIVLIASLLHQSALILIPIYFLVRRKAWTLVTFMLLIFAILLVLGYNQFSEFLFSTISDTQYGHYQTFSEGGANIIRVVVEAVPLIIAFLGREKLREIFPHSDIVVNMSLLSLVFMIIATQNWIFARFNIYFGLYQLILITWVVKIFTPKNQKFIYYCILVCYFIFYYYESVITLDVKYGSNILGI